MVLEAYEESLNAAKSNSNSKAPEPKGIFGSILDTMVFLGQFFLLVAYQKFIKMNFTMIENDVGVVLTDE